MALGLGSSVQVNLASTQADLANLTLTPQPPVFGIIAVDPSGDGSGPFGVQFNNGNFADGIVVEVGPEGPHLLEITLPDQATEDTYFGQAVRPNNRSLAGASDGVVIGIYKATNPSTDVTTELLLVRTFGAAPFYYQVEPPNVTVLKGR